MYIGYCITHPIALEGALKLKEITCAHCEGIRTPRSSSEFKYGPLSAVHDGYQALFITAPSDEAMMINHVNEVTTRGGRAIALTTARRRVHDRLRRGYPRSGSLPVADFADAADAAGFVLHDGIAGHEGSVQTFRGI